MILVKNIQRVIKSGLVKNIVVVASGTAGAQVLGLLFVPIITRLYGPEVYGTLGAFIALLGILSTIGALTYPVAVVLPRRDEVAVAIIRLALAVAGSMSLAVLVLIYFFGEPALNILNITTLDKFVYLIPIVMFLTGCQEVAQQWLIRSKKFKAIANITVLHSLVNYGAQALAGLFAPVAGALIGLHALAIALRAMVSAAVGAQGGKKEKRKRIPISMVAYKYRDFPLYRAPQVLLNAVSQSLPVLMLTAFFGPAAAGFYSLTRVTLGVPSTLLASSVQSVFYPHFNESALSKKQISSILIKAILGLAVVGVWPFIVVIFFGPILFSSVFGDEWLKAGQYAQWLSLWLYFNLINRPSIAALPVLNLQKWFLKFELVSISARVIVIFIGFTCFNDVTAIALFSLIGAVLALSLIFKTVFESKKVDAKNTDVAIHSR